MSSEEGGCDSVAAAGCEQQGRECETWWLLLAVSNRGRGCDSMTGREQRGRGCDSVAGREQQDRGGCDSVTGREQQNRGECD